MAVAAVLLLAACGGGSDSADTSDTNETSASIEATGGDPTTITAAGSLIVDGAGLVGYDVVSQVRYADVVDNRGGFIDLTIKIPRAGDATGLPKTRAGPAKSPSWHDSGVVSPRQPLTSTLCNQRRIRSSVVSTTGRRTLLCATS